MGDDRFSVRAIGVVRSPFTRKVDAPRQPRAAEGVEGRVELDRAYEHAVEDLEGFEHVWVIAWMDRAGGYRPKVHPPRSEVRRGVFATRSPHRPNPIALSAVELVRVEGTVLHVRGIDLLDGTPVLDVKPYVPWTDAIPRSRVGWLEAEGRAIEGEDRPVDPGHRFVVEVTERAAAQLAWLRGRGEDLEPTLRTVLETSPRPRPYRRIRPDATKKGGFVLALSEWRMAFTVDGERVTVWEIRSGYRPSERAAHELHHSFTSEEW